MQCSSFELSSLLAFVSSSLFSDTSTSCHHPRFSSMRRHRTLLTLGLDVPNVLDVVGVYDVRNVLDVLDVLLVADF